MEALCAVGTVLPFLYNSTMYRKSSSRGCVWRSMAGPVPAAAYASNTYISSLMPFSKERISQLLNT